MAVTNQRFVLFSSGEQILYLLAFLFLALAMGLIMAPAAFQRQAGRGKVTRRFVDLSSTFLTLAMIPLILAFAIDTYLVARLILEDAVKSGLIAGIVALVLAALWFLLPAPYRHRRR